MDIRGKSRQIVVVSYQTSKISFFPEFSPQKHCYICMNHYLIKMGKIFNIVIVVIGAFELTIGVVFGQKDPTYQFLQEGFKNPPPSAHPKVYWWCLNGNIDTITAKQELAAMKKAGIGGFDFFEIGVPKEDTMIPGGPAFLSDGSLKNIQFAVREAGKLGLEMGLNLASSWNAGGAWTLPINAGKSLYFSKTIVTGTSDIQQITVPFPEIAFPKKSLIGGTGNPMIPIQSNGRPVYYEDVAVLAIPAGTLKNSLDTAKVINVSNYFDPVKDVLNWKVPAGNWEIMRYVCSNSGQEVVLPSPKSAGLTVDHFDSVAVRTHLMYIINRLKPVLGDFRKTALKSFYLASYEARGFVWTSTLASEFKKVNGYEVYKFLPSFFDKTLFSQETTKQVEVDFRKTLSELMINNLYKNSKEICNRYGLKINSEAGGPGFPLYNGPAEPLKALGALDIPRGEFWVNHSRNYMDNISNDSIDILRVVKEVAAAAHIYQKGMVEEEAFTSFQHWQEGPFDIKPQGDRAFCEGMNRVVFHGFSHNITGSGFPGYVYHAGTHFNNKRVWWPKVKPFVEYLSRISAVFQQTNFVADVLYYYGDKVPNSAAPKNTHFMVGAGYDYEVINTEILLTGLSVKDGKLILSNGANFSLLALNQEDEINPAVSARLSELARQGARIVRSNPLGMLQSLGIPPDINYQDMDTFLLDFIHYQKNEVDFYFIRNTTDQWVSRECGFRQQIKVPEIWNPVTGQIVPVSVYNHQDQYTKVPLTLAPFGSYFVVFRKGSSATTYTSVAASNQNPPFMEYTSNGILFLSKGDFELRSKSGSKRIENNPKVQLIDGDWKVTFAKGWGAPDSAVFPGLSSWTNHEISGIKYYSGIGTYHKTFQFERSTTRSNDQRIFLDLGNISKVSEVWLNGRSLGIVWAKPYRYDITSMVKNGANTLTVEVANTWSNRLTGDAITGEKFTNTNIVNTIIPAKSIVTGDQTRIRWAKVPLIESGLLGPVTIQTFHTYL